MSKSTITGTVDGVSDYGKNDYFNIALDDAERKDNWYIGDGSSRDFVDGGVEKGDNVRLTVNKNKGSVTDIEVVGSGSDDSSGEAEDSSDMDGQGMAEGAATDSFVSKQERIKVQCAFKKAVDQVDRRSTETESDYREMVRDLTLIHMDVLDEVMNQ